MLRYTSQLLCLTVFALVLIWLAGPGDAGQLSQASAEPVLWADTVQIDLNELNLTPDSATQTRDSFMKNVRKLTQTAFNIRNQYMEEVDVDKIIRAGIVGMLTDLDRFSVLMEKSSYDALM